MRFVRYYTHATTGEVLAVHEQGTPFVDASHTPPVPHLVHDMGLVEYFEPKALDGTACTPASHIFERLLHRDADGNLYVYPGETLPKAYACPVSMDALEAHVRDHGAHTIPAVAQAWLTFVMPEHHARRLGVFRGLPLSVVKSLDLIRGKCDSSYGSLRMVLERKLQAFSDEDARARHHRRRIKAAVAAGEHPREVARRFGVDKEHVDRVVAGEAIKPPSLHVTVPAPEEKETRS
jgi:hypothetical protein